MLNENYKNALIGFKAHGDNSKFSDGCESEAQHIYRIVMTENLPVTELSEHLLETFLEREMSGDADYSKSFDRDGLKYVDLEQDVEIYPCVGGGFLEPIYGEKFCLSSLESKSMLSQLTSMGKLNLITDTIQSLAQRHDGTKLQTALPELTDVKTCISLGLVLPKALIEKLTVWESMKCSVVNFDFVEKQI